MTPRVFTTPRPQTKARSCSDATTDYLMEGLCLRPSYITASITLEVKQNHAYVKTPGYLRKFTENEKFCKMYGLTVMMVVSTLTSIKNIDKIDFNFIFSMHF